MVSVKDNNFGIPRTSVTGAMLPRFLNKNVRLIGNVVKVNFIIIAVFKPYSAFFVSIFYQPTCMVGMVYVLLCYCSINLCCLDSQNTRSEIEVNTGGDSNVRVQFVAPIDEPLEGLIDIYGKVTQKNIVEAESYILVPAALAGTFGTLLASLI